MIRGPARGAALGLVILLLIDTAAASDRLGARLRHQLATAAGDGPFLVWVYLRDKGTDRAAPPTALVSPRSLQRRAKVLPPTRVVDAADLPLDGAAVAQVATRVEKLRHRSRWFNAVSVLATRRQIDALQSLPCVRSIEVVTRFRRGEPEPETSSPPPSPPGRGPDSKSRGRSAGTRAIDYGPSLQQSELEKIPALHERGLHGEGVLIGHFDDGYRLLSHEALTNLHVVATHDFVDGDEDPAPRPSDPNSFGAHGISTLAVLAGYAPGRLVGPAYAADLVLARTENDGSETPLEEDNWVAAIEWADSLGIDVASTSLGYLTYDAPYPSWTWQDMNGNTTLITRAADMAVARGIVVVNAAGNGGLDATHNTLVAPADGNSVLAVGGVWPNGNRNATSSVGPTTNLPPRIKPDVMAQGTAVYIAATGSTTHYAYSAGTSFSCPLAAGIAALLLQAQPNATPIQIRDALRNTASRAATPDNQYGWGIIDATAALDYLTTAVHRSTWSDMKGRYR